MPEAFVYSFIHKYQSVVDNCYSEVGMPFISAMVKHDKAAMNDLILKSQSTTMSVGDLVNARLWATICMKSDVNIVQEALNRSNLIAQEFNEELKIEGSIITDIAMHSAFVANSPISSLRGHCNNEDYEGLKLCTANLLMILANQMDQEKEIGKLLRDINKHCEINVDLVEIERIPALIARNALRIKRSEEVAKLLSDDVKQVIVGRCGNAMQLDSKGELCGKNYEKVHQINELCDVFLRSFIEHVCKKSQLVIDDERLKQLKVSHEIREKIAGVIVDSLQKDKVLYNDEGYARTFLKCIS